MSNPTFFVQECPTCGRRLQIRVEYLGRKLVCQHCQGQLVGTDATTVRYQTEGATNSLIHKADELLEALAHQKPQLQ